VAGINVAIDTSSFNTRLTDLLKHLSNLSPVWEEAAEYMKRSTINRILRSKRSPSGERWAALSELTIALKGHVRQLFETGELAQSVKVSDVSDGGFIVSATADHASYMQDGVKKIRGKYRSNRPSPQVPPRPFMGFSDENKKRIAKMLRDYLASGHAEIGRE
jgi:phage virion morphogenesis protein